MIIIDIIKLISSGDFDDKKTKKNIKNRVIASIMIFLIPSIVGVALNLTGNALNYGDCLNNSNRDYINLANANKAEMLLNKAENTKDANATYKSQKYINKIKDENFKEQLQNRLDVVKKYIDDQNKKIISNSLKTGGYYSTGNCDSNMKIVVHSSEPDPSCAINYWGFKNKIDSSNFIYPKDSNGNSLGAWPQDYNNIPTQLSNLKTYQSGRLIWPVTPINSKYISGYEHNGFDISAPIGTPVYSPVNGTLVFSSWGNTHNKGSDETAYIVEILMDNSLKKNGSEINKIFLTHLCGIVNRCTNKSSCNKKVVKGELIGFVGNASGDASAAGYAPHLHMSIYKSGHYKTINYYTSEIERLYNITNGTIRKAGE